MKWIFVVFFCAVLTVSVKPESHVWQGDCQLSEDNKNCFVVDSPEEGVGGCTMTLLLDAWVIAKGYGKWWVTPYSTYSKNPWYFEGVEGDYVTWRADMAGEWYVCADCKKIVWDPDDPDHWTACIPNINECPAVNHCNGQWCNAGCRGDWCACECYGDHCAAYCTGNKCGRLCNGRECACGCQGIGCNEGCNGEDCDAKECSFEVRPAVETPIPCYGGKAEVSLTMPSALEPFTVQYRTVTTDGEEYHAEGLSPENLPFFPAGNHSFDVTDKYGVHQSTELEVTQPDELSVFVRQAEILTLPNMCPVKVHVTVAGGTGTRIVAWTQDHIDGPTPPHMVFPAKVGMSPTTPQTTELSKGTTKFIATDENGCVATDDPEIACTECEDLKRYFEGNTCTINSLEALKEAALCAAKLDKRISSGRKCYYCYSSKVTDVVVGDISVRDADFLGKNWHVAKGCKKSCLKFMVNALGLVVKMNPAIRASILVYDLTKCSSAVYDRIKQAKEACSYYLACETKERRLRSTGTTRSRPFPYQASSSPKETLSPAPTVTPSANPSLDPSKIVYPTGLPSVSPTSPQEPTLSGALPHLFGLGWNGAAWDDMDDLATNVSAELRAAIDFSRTAALFEYNMDVWANLVAGVPLLASTGANLSEEVLDWLGMADEDWIAGTSAAVASNSTGGAWITQEEVVQYNLSRPLQTVFNSTVPTEKVDDALSRMNATAGFIAYSHKSSIIDGGAWVAKARMGVRATAAAGITSPGELFDKLNASSIAVTQLSEAIIASNVSNERTQVTLNERTQAPSNLPSNESSQVPSNERTQPGPLLEGVHITGRHHFPCTQHNIFDHCTTQISASNELGRPRLVLFPVTSTIVVLASVWLW